jgi:hypothetical protein
MFLNVKLEVSAVMKICDVPSGLQHCILWQVGIVFLRHVTPAYSESTKIKTECSHKVLAANFATSKNVIVKITMFAVITLIHLIGHLLLERFPTKLPLF